MEGAVPHQVRLEHGCVHRGRNPRGNIKIRPTSGHLATEENGQAGLTEKLSGPTQSGPLERLVIRHEMKGFVI